MTYLSRIWLNPQRAHTRQLVANPQAMHAAVLSGLPDQPVTERVLWRLDPDARTGHRLQLLVLTRTRPSWQHIVERTGWPDAEEPQTHTRPYQPLLDQVVLGREFAFRLRANPVSTTKRPNAPSGPQKERLASRPRPRGVRVPHRTAAHQLAWFTSRTHQWGFTLPADEAGQPAVRLIGRDRLSFRKGGDREPVVLQTATYDGLLRVTDPRRLRAALLDGVGAGKAYGLGLLTLAPPTIMDADGA